MIHKTLWTMKTSDGHSFRNTISMFKNENPEITLLISSTTIGISFTNKGNNCIHDISIRAEDLQYYNYNIAGQDYYPITLNTNQFLNTTKGVGKKDAIKIKWIEGWKRLIIQLEKSGKDSNRASDSFVDIIDKRYNKLEFSNEFTLDYPSIKILSTEFSNICAHISSLKCSYMEITGSINKMIFKGMMADETVATIREHIPYIYTTDSYKEIDSKLIIDKIQDNVYQLNIIKPEEFIKIKIPLLTVKTLSKLQNISPNGSLLKFYFVPNKPLKIESNIGTYGTYNMYLRNPNKI